MTVKAFKSAVLTLSSTVDKGFVDSPEITMDDLLMCSEIVGQVRGGKMLYKLSGEAVDGEGREIANRGTLSIEGTDDVCNFRARASADAPKFYFDLFTAVAE